jgi:hypothetical protein
MDQVNFLEELLRVLDENHIRYCVVGGQGVNAYVEPLVSLDLDIVFAAGDLAKAEAVLGRHFKIERFPHSLNLSAPSSDLRVKIRTDPRYAEFVDRAEIRSVLGVHLPVARIEDILQGKIWAADDESRRTSKRRKDLLDIERILESRPDLRPRVPEHILRRFV